MQRQNVGKVKILLQRKLSQELLHSQDIQHNLFSNPEQGGYYSTLLVIAFCENGKR